MSAPTDDFRYRILLRIASDLYARQLLTDDHHGIVDMPRLLGSYGCMLPEMYWPVSPLGASVPEER